MRIYNSTIFIQLSFNLLWLVYPIRNMKLFTLCSKYCCAVLKHTTVLVNSSDKTETSMQAFIPIYIIFLFIIHAQWTRNKLKAPVVVGSRKSFFFLFMNFHRNDWIQCVWVVDFNGFFFFVSSYIFNCSILYVIFTVTITRVQSYELLSYRFRFSFLFHLVFLSLHFGPFQIRNISLNYQNITWNFFFFFFASVEHFKLKCTNYVREDGR